jgi:hypothetical protein
MQNAECRMQNAERFHFNCDRIREHDARVIDNLLKFRDRLGWFVQSEIGLAAEIGGIHRAEGTAAKTVEADAGLGAGEWL